MFDELICQLLHGRKARLVSYSRQGAWECTHRGCRAQMRFDRRGRLSRKTAATGAREHLPPHNPGTRPQASGYRSRGDAPPPWSGTGCARCRELTASTGGVGCPSTRPRRGILVLGRSAPGAGCE